MSASSHSSSPRAGDPASHRLSARIFAISVLVLFLELVLIRWVSTEIRIFAYLQNTVLVVCFLGLGIGAFTSRRTARLGAALGPLVVLMLAMAIPASREQFARISERLAAVGDFIIWHAGGDRPSITSDVTVGLALTLVMMSLILAAFVPLGRLLGRMLDEHPRTIQAYSLNVAGSLVGSWLLVLLSIFRMPPVVWFALVAVGSLPFLGRGRGERQIEVTLALALVALAPFTGARGGEVEVSWSPYQKLALRRTPPGGIGEYELAVNNTGYQVLIDLDAATVASEPARYPPELAGRSQYDLPSLLHPDPRNVLIVGAGSGNDAAGALRNGVSSVTAVEIDPVIVSMGRRYHPERPYDRPEVRVITDDARSFFSRTDERFDVIVMGLLDSHTTTALTNARLDHYVYTVESLRQARSLLTEGGLIVMTFDAQRWFIADRIAGALREVFGQDPLVFPIPETSYGLGGLMFVAGDLSGVQQFFARDPGFAALVREWSAAFPIRLAYETPLATDDWPYLYLPGRTIPLLYSLLAGLLVVLFVVGGRLAGFSTLAGRWGRRGWHFFFLGGGFLLLEVQNISKASLALGSTWWVNSVIISGVLIMVLAANWIAARRPSLPLKPIYAALLLSCVGLYALDLSALVGFPYAVRAVVVGILTTLPMLFSGIVFIRSFAAADRKDLALGANLVGALVGGLLQSVTFLIGVKALLLVVAAFYALVFLTRPRSG